MRCLSLVECVEVKFSGKILKEAICLGDVNNDGLSELVVGNTDGDIFIYRGERCICKASDLGTVSAIAVGDLLNISKNITIVITVEGWCHLFDVEFELNMQEINDDMSSIDASASIAEFKIIQPFHSQRIMPSIKEAKVGDSNNNGKVELIVVLTDRALRTYQWCSELDFDESGADKHLLEGDEKAGDDQRSEVSDLVFNGKLKPLNKWEFPNQIGSIALHQEGKCTSILVSQPGGMVSKLTNVYSNQVQGPALVDKQENTSDKVARSRNVSSNSRVFDMEQFTLNVSKTQNPNASTEVVGNILPFEAGEEADHYAVATLDGTILLCHENSFELVTQLEAPILAMESCNGSFVVIGWEGETYLVNRTMDVEVENCIINFNFEENVAGFKVGPYAFPQKGDDDGTHLLNHNCFVYVTFHESIYIYPNQYL